MLTRAFTILSKSSIAPNRLSSFHRFTTASSSNTSARFMTTTNGSDDDENQTSIVQICTTKIMKALETSNVKVTGAYDDPNGSHISIEVTSSLFEGKRAVQRQQMVYKALWDELQGPVHAVDSMICKTPQED